MCDIYTSRCARRGCTAEIVMHLADFSTARNEIKVWCHAHRPRSDKDIVGWWFSRVDAMGIPCYEKLVWVQALTANAREHWEGNCPNEGSAPASVFGDSDEKRIGAERSRKHAARLAETLKIMKDRKK